MAAPWIPGVVSGTRLICMVQGHHPSHQYGSYKIQHYGWPYLLRTNGSTPWDYLNRHLEGIPSLPDFLKNCGFLSQLFGYRTREGICGILPLMQIIWQRNAVLTYNKLN
jgi:hypothetical protein